MGSVIAPDNMAPAEKQAPVQQEFEGIMAVLGVKAAHELPAGAGLLTAKELIFVSRLITHGRMSQAASEAGCKGEALAVAAHKMLRRPAVQAFYGRCVSQLAANANHVIARLCERSVAAHAEAMKAYQAMQDVAADELAVDSESESVSQGAESSHTSTRTDRIRAREQAARDFLRFSAAADKADHLLGQLLGRINPNVINDVKVLQVTRGTMEILADIRRQSLTPAQVAAN